MDSFRSTLLEIWRLACLNIELSESVSHLGPLLAKHLPIATLAIRKFDSRIQGLETIALWHAEEHLSLGDAHTPCTVSAWRRCQTWGKSSELIRVQSRKQTAMSEILIPWEVERETLIVPLASESGVHGAAYFLMKEGSRATEQQIDMIRALIESLTTALENDLRLQELLALREAAEADRRSLLTRLGRQEENEAIIGADTGLRQVVQRIEMVADSDVPVLILGDTGTGKEVVARAIHVRSARQSAPFIRVNCGAIPSELIDSQLFGHEKGSFTGASEQRKGWFERANGGTLFLDEMGELPLAAQVRLLRVLQEHQIERVGGQEMVHIDVRIVAATHRDLASMVSQRTFREDLWYRINVFPIMIPRLKERLEDIPALAKHFAQRAAARFGLNFVAPNHSDLRLLASYSWPGNIRELQAVIDRATILGGGQRLEIAKSLGTTVEESPVATSSDEPTFYEVVPESIPRKTISSSKIATLDEAMKAHIERALELTKGKIEGKNGTAEVLGINPHTLRARMRKLKISWDRFRE